MKKSENISVKYPLSINFKTYQQYDLNNTNIDEIVFFEWLVVKRLSFGSDEFFYQNHRVFKDLGIKRSRLEKIQNKFSDYGLVVEPKGLNNATNYNVTDEFIRNFIYTHLLESYQKGTLKQLLNLDFKNEVKVSRVEKKKVLELIKDLEIIYNNRRTRKVQYTKGSKYLERSGLSHNNKTYQQFKLLMSKYTVNEVIHNSFVCYVDNIIKGDDKTLHILNNFSSYNRTNDSFPIFESRLNTFNNDYAVNNYNNEDWGIN